MYSLSDFRVRFCCNVLRNSQVIDIAMTFLGNKFRFKLDLYFMRYIYIYIYIYIYTNTKNKT